MNKLKIAKQLVKIAKELVANNEELKPQEVKKIIQNAIKRQIRQRNMKGSWLDSLRQQHKSLSVLCDTLRKIIERRITKNVRQDYESSQYDEKFYFESDNYKYFLVVTAYWVGDGDVQLKIEKFQYSEKDKNSWKNL